MVAVPPRIAILVMSTSGSSDSETQKRISGIVNGLTTLDGPVDHSVESVAAGDAHRYDLACTATACRSRPGSTCSRSAMTVS